MNRFLVHDSFGGAEVLRLERGVIPEPGDGEIRIRITVAGLNPVDWQILASEELAGAFGVALPSGFGNDFAGIIDAVGRDVSGWSVGERVFGGLRGSALADFAVVAADDRHLHRTPAETPDLVAGVIDIAGRTASAVIDALALDRSDVVLIGAAGGGVGTIVTQRAVATGARVLGTGSAASAPYLRSLGAEPVEYGAGLADRVRAVSPNGVTAAADLFGIDTALAALELGADRVVTIEADDPPAGVRPINGSDARVGALEELVRLVGDGRISVPVAATFPLEQYGAAIERQRSRHVQGKIAVVL